MSLSYTEKRRERAVGSIVKKEETFHLQILQKVIRDAFSWKNWILIIATVRFDRGKMSDVVWASIIIALLGMREYAEHRYNEQNDH